MTNASRKNEAGKGDRKCQGEVVWANYDNPLPFQTTQTVLCIQNHCSEKGAAGFSWLPEEPTAQRKAPASGDGILGDARMDSVVPKVKLEGKQETTGCRLIRAVSD